MTHFRLATKPEINTKIFYKLKALLRGEDSINSFEAPDFIIVVGGDGTILKAERDYPNIPKITFRDSDVGSKCSYRLEDFDKIINQVSDGDFDILYESKLYLKNTNLVALNEIQLHNKSPISAVRFSIKVDDKMLYENVIGDGVIIATPFGSSGYFSSVIGGGGNFGYGDGYEGCVGIALNNPYNLKHKEVIVPVKDKIIIKLYRENGIFIADNNPIFIDAKENKEYIIQVSDKPAQFVEVR